MLIILRRGTRIERNSFMGDPIEETEIFQYEYLGDMVAVFKKKKFKGFNCERGN